MKENENNEENKIETKEKEEINVEEIQNEIKDLEKKLEDLIKEEKYDECEITNNKIEELKAKIGIK